MCLDVIEKVCVVMIVEVFVGLQLPNKCLC